VARLERLAEGHRLPAHAEEGHQIISRAALQAAISGIIDDSAAVRTIVKLSSRGPKPIFLIPEPLPSENIVTTGPLWAGSYMSTLHDIYTERLRAMADDKGVGLACQGADTITKGAFTRACYSIGATQLNRGGAYGDDELLHMNSEFVAKILCEMLPRFLARLGRSTTAARQG